nr:hypothetical protein [Xanthomonas axonopodis]
MRDWIGAMVGPSLSTVYLSPREIIVWKGFFKDDNIGGDCVRMVAAVGRHAGDRIAPNVTEAATSWKPLAVFCSTRRVTLHDECGGVVPDCMTAPHRPSPCQQQRLLVRLATLLTLRVSRSNAAGRDALAVPVQPRRSSAPKRLFSSQRIGAGKRYRAVMPTC